MKPLLEVSKSNWGRFKGNEYYTDKDDYIFFFIVQLYRLLIWAIITLKNSPNTSISKAKLICSSKVNTHTHIYDIAILILVIL